MRQFRRGFSSVRFVALIAAVLVVVSMLKASAFAAEPADAEHAAKMAAGLDLFKTTVRGVLVGRCLLCHGGEKTESEFDLSTREKLLAGGAEGEAISPGNSSKSRLVKLINHTAKPHMPEKGAKLSEEAIAAVTKWIDLGAPYDKPLIEKNTDPNAWVKNQIDSAARQFWSFQPLKKVSPPAVKNEAACAGPIDHFLLAKLEEKSLAFSPPVDKRRLIRRAYFDLTGLPPAPEEVEKFVSDNDPAAYEKLLDKLLGSQEYGERWARYWLDVSRFAESHGFEQDYDRPFAFHFRDFVIEALNQDMPFDQFVRWQLAGDEFEPENRLALKATGFLGAGVFPTQITANEVERTRYDALDDMAATTGTAFLGLTVGCARCHDHKFDPIPSADYYRMVATFTTTVRSNIDVPFDTAEYAQQKAKFDAEHAPLAAALKKYEAEQLPAKFAAWEASHPRGMNPNASWVFLNPTEMKSQGGATLTKQEDGSVLASGANPDFDTYTFVAETSERNITGIRLEALSHPSFVKGGPGRAENGNIALTDFRVTARPKAGGAEKEIELVNPQATFNQGNHLHVKFTIDEDRRSAWAVDPQFGKDHAAVYETKDFTGFEGGTILTFTLEHNNNQRHNIGRARLSITTAPRPIRLDDKGNAVSQKVDKVLSTAASRRTPADNAELLAWFAPQDPEWKKLRDAEQAHLKLAPTAKTEKIMVASEGVPPIRHHTQGADFFKESYYLRRGDCEQKSGVATAGFLQVLTNSADGEKHWAQTPPAGSKTSYRRRALANWITDLDAGAGQLLARVMVNRIWQHHFGTGIVSTPNDFGFQGDRPSHPELLDWLARDFIDGGWKIKRLHKAIMLSQAYRQGSQSAPAAVAVDPKNRLLWRYSPHRLEAEAIRDSMLAVSGTLDRKLYGAGTLDEGSNRRSIYYTVKRSRLIPMMQLFDSPEPLVSAGDRPATVIAPQALLFMNSPHVRRYAVNFAAKLKDDMAKSPADAIRRGYLMTVGRAPSESELADITAFFDAQEKAYAADKKENARDLALADVCQTLFCLNEFVFVD